jgi:hypothetical protein
LKKKTKKSVARPLSQADSQACTARDCLFRLLAASGHQKLLRTAKRSAFQPASIKFVRPKTIQNQHKHIISWIVVIVGIRHFLDPEPYEQLYLPPHVIVMILKFFPQPDSSHSQIFRKAGQKKAEPNRCPSPTPQRTPRVTLPLLFSLWYVGPIRQHFLLHSYFLFVRQFAATDRALTCRLSIFCLLAS